MKEKAKLKIQEAIQETPKPKEETNLVVGYGIARKKGKWALYKMQMPSTVAMCLLEGFETWDRALDQLKLRINTEITKQLKEIRKPSHD